MVYCERRRKGTVPGLLFPKEMGDIEEIAAREKCKHPAVAKSVKAALDKLKNILEE